MKPSMKLYEYFYLKYDGKFIKITVYMIYKVLRNLTQSKNETNESKNKRHICWYSTFYYHYLPKETTCFAYKERRYAVLKLKVGIQFSTYLGKVECIAYNLL